jgi:hypothetical protein
MAVDGQQTAATIDTIIHKVFPLLTRVINSKAVNHAPANQLSLFRTRNSPQSYCKF